MLAGLSIIFGIGSIAWGLLEQGLLRWRLMKAGIGLLIAGIIGVCL